MLNEVDFTVLDPEHTTQRKNILKEKAEDFGMQWGLMDFKASSGWFENLKKEHHYLLQNLW